MANVLVTVTGSKRDWKGTPVQFEKHGDAIQTWCDGAEVECWQATGEWAHIPEPQFDVLSKYRIYERKPKAGEVWIDQGESVLVLSDSYVADIVSGTLHEMSIADLQRLEFFAPDLRTYYAREFLAENDLILSGSETSVESYTGTLIAVMEKYAQLENEK